MDAKSISIGDAKEGKYIIVDGVACVVKSVQKSKPGKHGHSKCRIEAVPLNGTSKKIFVKPANDTIDSPIIDKEVAQILSVSGDTANVMNMSSYETIDLKVPDEFKDEVKEGLYVAYWIVLGDKIMKQIRKAL